MRYRWPFIFLGLALLPGSDGCKGTTSQNVKSENLTTITGRYSYIGNPCTTKPCLPGMAYALEANDQYYYLTIDDYCFSENRSWDGYAPELNDLVKVSGYLGKKKDVFGKTFCTIEVASLLPAK